MPSVLLEAGAATILILVLRLIRLGTNRALPPPRVTPSRTEIVIIGAGIAMIFAMKLARTIDGFEGFEQTARVLLAGMTGWIFSEVILRFVGLSKGA